MANLHEWRKRAALHTRCHGGAPAEFMSASFARSKQLLSATALWEALCMKLEGRGKVANQWLRQVALKLLDVLQIEQLAVPVRSGRDRLGEMQWRKRSLPCSCLISPRPLIHTLLFFSRKTFMFHESQVCALSTRIELFMLFFSCCCFAQWPLALIRNNILNVL